MGGNKKKINKKSSGTEKLDWQYWPGGLIFTTSGENWRKFVNEENRKPS